MVPNGQNGINFEDAPFSSIHKKIAVGTFMGQICDGYILGIVGIALSYATGALGLDSFWMGLIGAGALFGILLGSLLTGIIIDRVGRRAAYAFVAVFSLVLSVLQFFLSDPTLLVIVRFLLGMCVGADYTVGVALLSEWTPEKVRTKMMSWLMAAWTFGYIISYFAGFFIASLGDMGENGWRWIICSSAVLALITLIVRLGTPESPSWTLAKRGAGAAWHWSISILAPITVCLQKRKRSNLLPSSDCSALNCGVTPLLPVLSSSVRFFPSLLSPSSCRWS